MQSLRVSGRHEAYGKPKHTDSHVFIVSMAASVYIGKHIAGQQGEWLAATEKRLEATKSMLSSLKAIKMMSASQRVRSAIEKLRVLEFAASKMYRTLLVASVLSCKGTLALCHARLFYSRVLPRASLYDGDLGASVSLRHIHRLRRSLCRLRYRQDVQFPYSDSSCRQPSSHSLPSYTKYGRRTGVCPQS